PIAGSIAPRLRFSPLCTSVSKLLRACRPLRKLAFTFVPCSTELRARSTCLSNASSRCAVRAPPRMVGAALSTVSVSIWMRHDAAARVLGSPEHGDAGTVVVGVCGTVTVVVVDAVTVLDGGAVTGIDEVEGTAVDVVVVDDLALVVVDDATGEVD